MSIVTPSLNQGVYLEETIRSVLLQNYPRLEYIVIDGGSTDETLAILEKYQPWLSYWVSEPDRGQSHAINKGFRRCTGMILNWLCSDDILLEGALQTVAQRLPTSSSGWIIGGSQQIVQNSGLKKMIGPPKEFSLANFVCWHAGPVIQPSIFWNRAIWDQVRCVDESLSYCMDVDLWYRFQEIASPIIASERFSQFRAHDLAKTTPASETHEDSLREFVTWLSRAICASRAGSDESEWNVALVTLQKELSALSRMRRHPVFGVLMRQWKRFVNRDFPV